MTGFFDNDADIEMAEFEAVGARASALRKRGICTHGSVQAAGPGNDLPLRAGQVQCLDCPDVFASEDDWFDARREVLS